MEFTEKLKERFCKDCGISIKIFQEPYFTERLHLYDCLYNSVAKWELFKKELENYDNEQDYFEEYNRVKDLAMDFIKSRESYQMFNNIDMNRYPITHKNITDKDIFKETNDGKTFISIDMRKANFSSMKHFNKDIFDGAETWEDFIRKFTKNEHIANSKYIRQVIMGNCNPKRQVAYEKYCMDQVLTFLEKELPYDNYKVVFFSNDEIVLDVTETTKKERLKLYGEIANGLILTFDIPFRVELFNLHKIVGTKGYYKEIYIDENKTGIDIKCLDSFMLPFVLRKATGQEFQESDFIFCHEGMLSKFVTTPKFELKKIL